MNIKRAFNPSFLFKSFPCLLSWAQPTPEFEVETLYLTAGIIIFDTLVPRAFQKYTTCMVFKAVQLFKKSATWFSENEGRGGGVKGRLELFRKFIRFGTDMLPLSQKCEINPLR